MLLMVQGFGRCGSSLTMQMLHAGGMPCAGTFPDFEPSGTGFGDRNAYLRSIANHNIAVKVLEPSLVPVDVAEARIIWLDRDPIEQAKSALKFLGQPGTREQVRALSSSYKRDRKPAREAGGCNKHPTLTLRFEDLIESTDQSVMAICSWALPVWPRFDMGAMMDCVRSRGTYGSRCLPFLLEAELVSEGLV